MLMCGWASLLAQDPQSDSSKAFLVNSYGESDQERIRSILDDFLASLDKSKGSEGVVIVRGPLDEVIERKLLVVRHVFDKNLDNLRIRFKVAISETEKKTELWVVPHGAEEPKVDQGAWVGFEIGEKSDVDTKREIKKFFDKVFSLRWELSFYVFNYGSPEFIANRKKVFFSNLERVPEFPDPRVWFVDGGDLRGNSTVIWLVPFGVKPPKP